MRIVYGPVPSWRFGPSLGIDPLCVRDKYCSFDCEYCQLGPTKIKSIEKRIFVEPKNLERELQDALKRCDPNIVTFSGTAEPTLAANLGELLETVRKVTDLPVGILTNSSLISNKGTVSVLKKFDVVSLKLDAATEETFQKVNAPVRGCHIDDIINGSIKFRKSFNGTLCLQTMFTKTNAEEANEIIDAAKRIMPDVIHIDTPLRKSKVPPLSKEKLDRISEKFAGLNFKTVYDSPRFKTAPLDRDQTKARRPE